MIRRADGDALLASESGFQVGTRVFRHISALFYRCIEYFDGDLLSSVAIYCADGILLLALPFIVPMET